MNARLAAYAIVIAAVLAAQPIRATTIHNIVLTEQTATSLTATYDGVPVNVVAGVGFINPNADAWIVTFPSTVSFSSSNPANWVEGMLRPPATGTIVNTVTFSNTQPQLSIQSDLGFPGLFGTVPNNTVLPGSVGTDSSDGGSISIRFNDLAGMGPDRTGGVPDAGSTFFLLVVSLIALFGASRLRSLRLA